MTNRQLATDIKAAISELAGGSNYPDLMEAVDRLAAAANAKAARIAVLEDRQQRYVPLVQRMMARLAKLLDEDQFNEMHDMVLNAGVQPPVVAVPSDAFELLHIWQTWLGANRDSCDEGGKVLWDRIDAVFAASAAQLQAVDVPDDDPTLSHDMALLELIGKIDPDLDGSIEDVRAASRKLDTMRVVPNGYVLVPVDASEEMVEAGCLALAGSIGGYEAGKVYKCREAMLAAAPKPESAR